MAGRCWVGCAGWSLPRAVQPQFPAEGSHLARYASVFRACEINSSFHRPHAPAVWTRWADSVPEGFRFSVKVPRTITHERRLQDCDALLDEFLAAARLLHDHLACLLVQLPPSLALDPAVASRFLDALRARWMGCVAAEPRHASWFTPEGDALLDGYGVARVLADPVRHAGGERPGGARQMVYLRLHGSPRTYYSAYAPALLDALAARIAMETAAGRDVWCIFDNTAAGAAADNALALLRCLGESAP